MISQNHDLLAILPIDQLVQKARKAADMRQSYLGATNGEIFTERRPLKRPF
jgi:hypothetical protein